MNSPENFVVYRKAIALGSAFETYAILDACKVMNLIDQSMLARGQSLLTEIVAMLTALNGQAYQFKSNSKL